MFVIKDVKMVFPDVVYGAIMNLCLWGKVRHKRPSDVEQEGRKLGGKKLAAKTVQCCHQSKNFPAVAEREAANAKLDSRREAEVSRWRSDCAR